MLSSWSEDPALATYGPIKKQLTVRSKNDLRSDQKTTYGPVKNVKSLISIKKCSNIIFQINFLLILKKHVLSLKKSKSKN